MGGQQITLVWDGEEYPVPPERHMLLIACVEDALTKDYGEGALDVQAVQLLSRISGPPHARLALAYAAALRFAGARIKFDDVYWKMCKEFAQDEAETGIAVQGYVAGLFEILNPPMAMRLAAMAQKKTEPLSKKTKPQAVD